MPNRKNSNKKIRIKDIAKFAGVSEGTVDRVIHNRDDVSEKTRDKIIKVLNEKGYRPNIIARALTSKKQYRFAALIPKADSGYMYWQFPLEGIKKAENELSSFHISVQCFFYDLNEESSFKEEAQKILDFSPDGIILAPCLIKESHVFINEITKCHIPFVLIDTYISVPNVPFVGEDGFQSGRVGAHLVDMMTQANDGILILSIVPDLQNIGHIHQRYQGFQKYFTEKITQKIIFTAEISDPKKISQELDRLILSNSKIKAIFIANSKTFMVAEYLQKNNVSNIHIVGYDLTDLNIKYLNLGYIDFLLSQQPFQQGYLAVTNLYYQIVLGQKPISIQNTPIDIISSENIQYYKGFF